MEVKEMRKREGGKVGKDTEEKMKEIERDEGQK